LVKNVGNGANFKNTTFDDAVAQSIVNGSAPFTSRFQPQQPLSVLKGRLSAGTYTLEIKNSGSVVGTLNSWALTLRKNATVSAIAVTFDRAMDPTTFDVSDLLRMSGPTGTLSLAGT